MSSSSTPPSSAICVMRRTQIVSEGPNAHSRQSSGSRHTNLADMRRHRSCVATKRTLVHAKGSWSTSTNTQAVATEVTQARAAAATGKAPWRALSPGAELTPGLAFVLRASPSRGVRASVAAGGLSRIWANLEQHCSGRRGVKGVLQDASSIVATNHAGSHDAGRGKVGGDLQRAAGELRHVDESESQGSDLHVEGESFARPRSEPSSRR